MFCKSCGREIAEGTQFCPYCGASQNSANNVATTQESKVWGILSLIFGILGGLLGLVFGIVGLCTYKEKQNRLMCKIGIGIFLLWIIIPIISLIIYFITLGTLQV